MSIFLYFVLVFVEIISLLIVTDAAEQRKGCSKGSAIFLSLFFTPIAGLLYCLNFPPKEKKSDNSSK